MIDDEQTAACDLLYGYVPYIKRNIPCLERGERGLKKAFVILIGISICDLR